MAQNLIETCTGCYTITLNDCVEQITVNAGLAPDTSYIYCLTDKFGNKYKEELTTNGEGKFVIHSSNHPSGLFNAYAGTFQLQVFETMHSCVPFDLTLCSETYTCVLLDFEKVSTGEDLSNAVIPCECREEAPPPPVERSVTLESANYGCGNDLLTCVFSLINFTQGSFAAVASINSNTYNQTVAIGEGDMNNLNVGFVVAPSPPAGDYDLSISIDGVTSNTINITVPDCFVPLTLFEPVIDCEGQYSFPVEYSNLEEAELRIQASNGMSFDTFGATSIISGGGSINMTGNTSDLINLFGAGASVTFRAIHGLATVSNTIDFTIPNCE